MRAKWKCVWVRKNNGILQARFERDDGVSPEYMIINVVAEAGYYEEGKHYWHTMEPAFPHEVDAPDPAL
jgi:hypothetical protein